MYSEMPVDKSKKISIIILLCIISSASRFAMDSYLPSLPAMSGSLGISGQGIQVTLTLYILGFGLSQLIYGPLSDRFGRKRILMTGLLLFLVANTVCALAYSLSVLLSARFLAGAGIGACSVLNRAIASDCFSGTAFSKAWSYTTTTLVLTLILAPLIGSIVQDLFDWRANFLLSTLYIGVIFWIIHWSLPETNDTHRLPNVCLSIVLSNYFSILSAPSFLTCTLCYTFAFAGLMAYFQVSPLLLMETFHLSVMEYGLSSLLIAFCYFLGGQIVTLFAEKIGTRLLLLLGVLLLTSSAISMCLWNYFGTPSLLSTFLPMAFYVVGSRVVIPNALSGAFEGLRNLGGSTSGLIGSIQMLGASIVSYLISLFSYSSPVPLALMLTMLSMGSLIAYWRYTRRI